MKVAPPVPEYTRQVEHLSPNQYLVLTQKWHDPNRRMAFWMLVKHAQRVKAHVATMQEVGILKKTLVSLGFRSEPTTVYFSGIKWTKKKSVQFSVLESLQ
jgi:hypothetical protein